MRFTLNYDGPLPSRGNASHKQQKKGADWRTREWATAALERAELQLRWATTATGDAARQLERAVLDALADVDLWNRAR
jgi:hypothetical protein